VLQQAALLQGLWWIVGSTGILADLRGSRSSSMRLFWPRILLRTSFYVCAVALVIAAGVQREALLYWVLPYCTWHIVANYLRVVCEHSGHISEHKDFSLSRTTVPGLLGRIFILPRNIGYHIEHHWYPSVPWYNLPALHRVLREDQAFSAHANVQHSVTASLRQCLSPMTVVPA
jgi:fatty acid desaturase